MPATLPPEKQSAYDDLCKAVGSLFIRWARLENSLAAGLRLHLAERMPAKNQAERLRNMQTVCAVFGSMRLKDSRDTMKRIATEECYAENVMEHFKLVFAHIGHIGSLRDTLAHQQLKPTETPGTWHLTNIATTRTVRSALTYQTTTDAIGFASEDLFNAAAYLDGFMTDDKFRPMQLAWQYKPSMLRLLPRKNGPSPEAPTPQPIPSGE
jgi:hypothetical protein